MADPRVPRARIIYHGFDLPDDLAMHTETLLYRPRDTPHGLSRKLDPAWTFLPPATDASIARTAIVPVSLFMRPGRVVGHHPGVIAPPRL